MRLFTRTVHLSGPPSEVMAFSTEMAGHVSATTGVEVGLWNVQFGAPVGTIVYSARIEGLAELESMTAALMADTEYHAFSPVAPTSSLHRPRMHSQHRCTAETATFLL